MKEHNRFERIKKIYYNLFKNIPNTKSNKKLLKELNDMQRSVTTNTKNRHKKFIKIFTIFAVSCPLLTSSAPNNTITTQSSLVDSINFKITSGKEVDLLFYNNHAQIKNSYNFNFNERIETLNYVIDYCQEQKLGLKRDIKSMESEWYVHNVCFDLGIVRDSTKDVDIDYVEDTRWYVNLAVLVAEIFYDIRLNSAQENDAVLQDNAISNQITN